MRIEFADHQFVLLWPVALILLIAVVIGLRRKGYGVWRLICVAVLGVYLLVALDLLFFPIRIVPVDQRWSGSWRWSINLIPFRFNFEFIPHVVTRQIIQNILLTVPFGFGISFVMRDRVRRIGLIALMVGIGTEAIQLMIGVLLGYPYRSTDVNDVMLNALGVLVGYGLFRVFAWAFLLLTYWLHPIYRGALGFLYEIASRTEPSFRPVPARYGDHTN